MVWSEPHAEPRASAGKLWARRLVTELRDLLSFRGKRSAGPGLARRGGPCLCGRALGLRVSRSRAQSRVCAALEGVGVCGAQRFPCRSAPGLPGSRRTRQSYGRYQTCRGTSCLEKGSAVNPSGRAGACVTPGCLSQCEGLVGLRNSQQTELPVQQTTRWAWSTASLQFPALFCLIPVVNSDRGAPAMSALPAATGWKLEMLSFVLHTWFCCSVLLLLLEMNSSLLSVSPFHKKAWLRAN